MTAERHAITVDIDNTILNNDRRKLEILQDRFNKVVKPEDLRKDYNLAKILLFSSRRREAVLP